MFSLLLVLVFLMVGGSGGGKRRRYSAQQSDTGIEYVGSECAPSDDSETESTNWKSLTPEVLSKKKGKEKGKEPASQGKGKEKLHSTRGRKRTGGIEIRDPTSDPPRRSVHQDAPVDRKRRVMYSSKQYIGERDIGVRNLIDRAPVFKALYENGVDTHCRSYEYSLGMINETTLIKSSVQLRSPPRPSLPDSSAQRRSTPPPAAPGPSQPSEEVSEEDMPVSSVYHEQQRLSTELERISAGMQRITSDQARIIKKLDKISGLVKAVFNKMGCCSADIPPQDTDSD